MDIESDMKFDYSIGTEDRFAFRKWLQGWINQFQKRSVPDVELALADEFVALGFADQALSQLQFSALMSKLAHPDKVLAVRMPTVNVTYTYYLYNIKGKFEIYIDGIICFDGDFKAKVKSLDESFLFVHLQFYPRMTMHVEV